MGVALGLRRFWSMFPLTRATHVGTGFVEPPPCFGVAPLFLLSHRHIAACTLRPACRGGKQHQGLEARHGVA